MNKTKMEKIIDTCLPTNDSDVESIDTDFSGDCCGSDHNNKEEHITLSNPQSLLSLPPANDLNLNLNLNAMKRSSALSIDLKNSFASSPCVRKVLTGVIVNGFHPQLCNWKENSKRQSSNASHYPTQQDGDIVHHHHGRSSSIASKRRKLSGSIQESITEQVLSARNQTAQEMSGTIPQWGKTELKILTSIVCSKDDKPNALQIYYDVFEDSNVAQIISAPGGRIAAWNQEFSNLFSSFMDESKPSLDTLTAFDIVEPTMIPKLYEIFLIALQEDLVKQHEQNFVNVLEGNDNAEVRYLALSVPCISDFGGEDEQYYITFSLMNDEEFAKRCFHCIISSDRPECVGEIFSICQNTLMEML